MPIILRIKKPPELSRKQNQQFQPHDSRFRNATSNLNGGSGEKGVYSYPFNPYQNYVMPGQSKYLSCTEHRIGNNNCFNCLTSPTHLELIRLTEKMKEYESLCHKHSCLARSHHSTLGLRPNEQSATNELVNEMTSDGTSDDLVQNGNICQHAFSGTYHADSQNLHDHLTQLHTITLDDQLLKSNLLADEGVYFETQGQFYHHLLTEPNSTNNPCCCCTCTGNGTIQTIDYFNSIMQELRFIANRYRREDDLADIIGEWKFAAIVIDRLCLIVFSTFAVLSLAICLASAPHLIA